MGNASARLRSMTTQTGRHRPRRDLARGVAAFDERSPAAFSTTRTARGGPFTRPKSPPRAHPDRAAAASRGDRGAQAVVRFAHRLTRVEHRRQRSRHEAQPDQRTAARRAARRRRRHRRPVLAEGRQRERQPVRTARSATAPAPARSRRPGSGSRNDRTFWNPDGSTCCKNRRRNSVASSVIFRCRFDPTFR